MSLPFSRRKQPPIEVFTYEIADKARNRIWHTIGILLERYGFYFDDSTTHIRKLILLQEGSMPTPSHYSSHQQVAHHFFNCENDFALDFIEYLCRSVPTHTLEEIVPSINRIFREEGVGYELTAYLYEPATHDNAQLGPDFPQIIHKDGEFVHEQIIRPALESLRNPKLATANIEMLKAHENYKTGKFEETIVMACASLESVLKTILHEKGEFNYEKDALVKLSERCVTLNVYPGPIHENVRNVGVIRNNMGGHGGGPNPKITANQEYADYVLQLSSSSINLLTKLVKL